MRRPPPDGTNDSSHEWRATAFLIFSVHLSSALNPRIQSPFPRLIPPYPPTDYRSPFLAESLTYNHLEEAEESLHRGKPGNFSLCRADGHLRHNYIILKLYGCAIRFAEHTLKIGPTIDVLFTRHTTGNDGVKKPRLRDTAGRAHSSCQSSELELRDRVISPAKSAIDPTLDTFEDCKYLSLIVHL